MSDSDLGPQPEPEIEPGEPNPGGADAIETDDANEPRDLDPHDNPAVEDALPDEMKQGEDTDTEATKDAEGAAGDAEESPA